MIDSFELLRRINRGTQSRKSKPFTRLVMFINGVNILTIILIYLYTLHMLQIECRLRSSRSILTVCLLDMGLRQKQS